MKRVLARRVHRKRPEDMREERRLLRLSEERLQRLHEGKTQLVSLREVLERAGQRPN